MTKYLEGEEITDAELEACLHKAVRGGVVAPVLVGSAAKDIGVRGLLDAIVRYLPSPADEPPVDVDGPKGDGSRARGRRPSGPLVVRVFKTTADPFVGRLTYLRVLSGTLQGQAQAWNATRRRGRADRPAAASPRQGPGAVGELKAGRDRRRRQADRDRRPATRSCVPRAALRLPPLAFPSPTLQVAIEPQTKARPRQDGLRPPAHARGGAAAPGSSAARPASRSCVTMGEAHVAVLAERLKRKFGAAIVTKTPRVPYKETIRGKTQVHGRYKKQTGGHGMFGDVWIEIEPNPDGGVEFAEQVVGGTVPKNFFPGVEKGIREAAAEGVLAGYPLSDFKATLYDGSFHTVDSNELSFKIAASMALKQGVHRVQAGPHGADHDGRDPHPRGLHGRRQPRSQRPPRPRSRHGHQGRDADHHRPRARRPSCSATPPSCARSPAAAARSRPRWTTTRTCPQHIAEKVIEAHQKEQEAAGH